MITLHSKATFFFANSGLNNYWFRHASVRIVIIFFSVQNVTVMLLAQWRIHVVLEVSVCAVVITLDLDVTSALQVITAIPAACVSKSLSSFYWSYPCDYDSFVPSKAGNKTTEDPAGGSASWQACTLVVLPGSSSLFLCWLY